jgi:nitroreductase
MSPSDAPAHVPDSIATALEQVVTRRRSVYAYLPDPVPRAVVERAIALAVMAPNHYRTRPWRFFVFADEGRARLAAAYEEAAIRLGRDRASARQRALDAPVMIVAGCVPSAADQKVKVWEEEFATAAAIENMLLAFACEDVGSLLTTGELAVSPEVHELVGLSAPGRVMAVVKAGYRDPARPLPLRPEPDPVTCTRWFTSP